LLALPIRGQALEEVVALDVVGVVSGWGIRRVEIGDRVVAFDREGVALAALALMRAVEHRGIECLRRFREEVAHRRPELTPAIVVARRGDREHAARLLPGGGEAEGADRDL